MGLSKVDEIHALVMAIDWDELFQEYKQLGISLTEFYKQHFRSLSARYVKSDHVISITTVRNWLNRAMLRARVREQNKAKAQASVTPATTNVEPASIIKDPKDATLESSVAPQVAATQPSSPAPDNSNMVTVVDLGDLSECQIEQVTGISEKDIAQINDWLFSKATPTPTEHRRQSPPIPPIPSQSLITEYQGIKFTFACNDPTDALASLLIKLRNNGLEF